ncbi:MAG: flagellin [Phycisphaerales bacterium JB039]
MTFLPAGVSRVPTLLSSQAALGRISRTNLDIFRAQEQLATGLAVRRFSDDAVRAAAINVLDHELERSGQWMRNLHQAQTSLDTIDSTLADVADIANEARSLASEYVGSTFTAEDRDAAAIVVQSLLDRLLGAANRTGPVGHIFSGDTPSSPAVDAMLGGYRYAGRGDGLRIDLGPGLDIPVTLGAGTLVGATSARVEGSADLTPDLAPDTRLRDLGGARGLGVRPGAIEFSGADGPLQEIDLTGADTVGDVVDRLTAAIRAYETEHGMTLLGPQGVYLDGGAIALDVQSDAGEPQTVQFFDPSAAGSTAADLGLSEMPDGRVMSFSSDSASPGAGLNPRLTWLTRVDQFQDSPYGEIRIVAAGRSEIVDLGRAETLEDVRNLIEGTGLGVRVEINRAGDGLNIISELAHGRDGALRIEEAPGGAMTATRLGIRSLSAETLLSDFNDGRGVEIVTGSVDPVTGLPDPARDVDFTITLGDGRAIDIDLRPRDIITVQDLLDRINGAAEAIGISVPDEFEARLSGGANGIVLAQGEAPGPITVEARNGSRALDQLGLAAGSYDPASASFAGTDAAPVRVDNLFTALIDLRDALEADDQRGITLAGERIERHIALGAETRGLVAGLARQVDDETVRRQDITTFDELTRSQLRDADFAEAATRFAQLQTQLQAALQSTAVAGSLSLLDFLG